jgi:hypothetical protein
LFCHFAGFGGCQEEMSGRSLIQFSLMRQPQKLKDRINPQGNFFQE